MPTRWFEIALPVDPSQVDEAAALLDLAGFGGVEVRDPSESTGASAGAPAGGASDVVVVVEVGSDDELGRATGLARGAAGPFLCGEPRVAELDPRIWTENWKQHFSRRIFGGRIEVRPPWEEPSAEENLVSIVINPGMAFGTGLHETTSACLEVLADEIRPGMRVADVGCGSGILAIAAARLGAADVLATDVDPLAVDATRENAEANAVASVVRVELEPGEIGSDQWEESARPGLSRAREGQPPRPNGATTGGVATAGGGFDVVIANILAETLVEMRDLLIAALRRGGILVLSGIEARRLKMVEEAFIGRGLRAGRTVTRGDWVTICLHSVLAEPAPGPSVPNAGTKSGPADADGAT